VFPHYSPAQIDRLIRDYRAVYLARGHTQTAVYPGVMEALTALPGRKATATTKGTPTTRAVLEQFGLIQYFDHVQGPTAFRPNPRLTSCWRPERVAGSAADCLMVGDSARIWKPAVAPA